MKKSRSYIPRACIHDHLRQGLTNGITWMGLIHILILINSQKSNTGDYTHAQHEADVPTERVGDRSAHVHLS